MKIHILICALANDSPVSCRPGVQSRPRPQGTERYTLDAMPCSRRTLFVLFAVLLTAFVTLHPYLDGAGLCDHGGCPEASQSSHAVHVSVSTACVAAVFVAPFGAALAFARFSGRRRVDDEWRPDETFLSPDTPPPRVLPVR